MTSGIHTSIINKEFLYLLHTNNLENNSLKQNYKLYQQILNNVIKAAKRIYENEKATNSSTYLKNMWECINKITGRHKSNKPKKGLDFIKVDGIKITNRLEIADFFNSFFTNIALA